jgi:hypothetical protein
MNDENIATDSPAMQPEPVSVNRTEINRDLMLMNGIRDLAGRIEDNTDETVLIWQDAKTRKWYCKAGETLGDGVTMREAIRHASYLANKRRTSK